MIASRPLNNSSWRRGWRSCGARAHASPSNGAWRRSRTAQASAAARLPPISFRQAGAGATSCHLDACFASLHTTPGFLLPAAARTPPLSTLRSWQTCWASLQGLRPAMPSTLRAHGRGKKRAQHHPPAATAVPRQGARAAARVAAQMVPAPAMAAAARPRLRPKRSAGCRRPGCGRR